jgi:cytochrome c
VACHDLNSRIVGPSFRDVATKYGNRPDAVDYLSDKIRSGGSGLWGTIAMPPQALSDGDAGTIAVWLAADPGK